MTETRACVEVAGAVSHFAAPISRVAAALGVGERTLYRWMSCAGGGLVPTPALLLLRAAVGAGWGVEELERLKHARVAIDVGAVDGGGDGGGGFGDADGGSGGETTAGVGDAATDQPDAGAAATAAAITPSATATGATATGTGTARGVADT
jgi:hypothetical protein